MFGRLTSRVGKQAMQVRHNQYLANSLYNNVWRKSNIMYLSTIAAGTVVFGFIYSEACDYIWEAANDGVSIFSLIEYCFPIPVANMYFTFLFSQKLYKHINWSKFVVDED
jgi:hypothetical protein